MPPVSESVEKLLQPLRADPARGAVLTDVDGTIAPIVSDPAAAAVPPAVRDELARLAGDYAIVACVSGRPAADARRIVGLDGLVYIGNHGLERLDPGAAHARTIDALAGRGYEAPAYAESLDAERLTAAGLSFEDKGPIRALHWRRAGDQERAEAIAAEVRAGAEEAGLRTHLGRKVLELRPSVAFDKGVAVAELLEGTPVASALYAGDDRTDLDSFRALRELAGKGAIENALCIGIDADESPPEIASQADATVPDPAAFAAVLAFL